MNMCVCGGGGGVAGVQKLSILKHSYKYGESAPPEASGILKTQFKWNYLQTFCWKFWVEQAHFFTDF